MCSTKVVLTVALDIGIFLRFGSQIRCFFKNRNSREISWKVSLSGWAYFANQRCVKLSMERPAGISN